MPDSSVSLVEEVILLLLDQGLEWGDDVISSHGLKG